MQTFGPFEVKNAEHMDSLAVLITAITLKSRFLCLLGESISYSSLAYLHCCPCCILLYFLHLLFGRPLFTNCSTKKACFRYRGPSQSFIVCLFGVSTVCPVHHLFYILSYILSYFLRLVLPGLLLSNYSTRKASI